MGCNNWRPARAADRSGPAQPRSPQEPARAQVHRTELLVAYPPQPVDILRGIQVWNARDATMERGNKTSVRFVVAQLPIDGADFLSLVEMEIPVAMVLRR